MGGEPVIRPLIWQINTDRAITLVEIAARTVESPRAIALITHYNYRILYLMLYLFWNL